MLTSYPSIRYARLYAFENLRDCKVALLRELSSADYYQAFGWENPRSLLVQQQELRVPFVIHADIPGTPSRGPASLPEPFPLNSGIQGDTDSSPRADLRQVRRRSVSWRDDEASRRIEAFDMNEARRRGRGDEPVQGSAMSGLGFMSALQRALCRPSGDRHALELLNTIAACCEVNTGGKCVFFCFCFCVCSLF